MGDLAKLLDDEQLRSQAVSPIVSLGPIGIPTLTRALDHPNELVRNYLIHALGRADSAVTVPMLNKAVLHQDEQVRNWAMRVVADVIKRGGPEVGKPDLTTLVDRLTTDVNDDTRYHAALALYNMDTLAEPAKAALEQAAEKDASHHVRELAEKVLANLQATRPQSTDWGRARRAQHAGIAAGGQDFLRFRTAGSLFYVPAR